MGKFIDLTGEKFSRLTVRSQHSRKSNGSVKWECICDCGNICTPDSHALRSGHTTSCGCLGRENNIKALTTHGLAKRGEHHPLFSTWAQMRYRCNNKTCKRYADYGGRGITVCDRWNGENGFVNFVSDMGERPAGHTLDRKDNNGPYSPENCRWATWRTQSTNTRTNVFIEAFGDRMTVSEWSKKLGVNQKTIACRMARGWAPEDCVSKKPREK